MFIVEQQHVEAFKGGHSEVGDVKAAESVAHLSTLNRLTPSHDWVVYETKDFAWRKMPEPGFISTPPSVTEVPEPTKAAEQINRICPVAHGMTKNPESNVTENEIVNSFFDFHFDGEALSMSYDHRPFNLSIAY